jgi:hypothetical protein
VGVEAVEVDRAEGVAEGGFVVAAGRELLLDLIAEGLERVVRQGLLDRSTGGGRRVARFAGEELLLAGEET